MTGVALLARCVALLLLAIATGYALHRFAWTPFRCISAATAAEATLDAANVRWNDHRTMAVARRIQATLKGCDCVSPASVTIPFTLGAAAEVTGEPAAAIKEYERALRIDRRPEIYFRLGLAQLDALDRTAAVESFTRACEFHPARLRDIPYKEIRQEVKERLLAKYGEDWVR